MSSTGFQNWAIAASELVESGISRLDAEIDCLEARFSAPVEGIVLGNFLKLFLMRLFFR